MKSTYVDTAPHSPDHRYAADAAPLEIGGVSLGLLSVPTQPPTWPDAFTHAERDIARHLIRGHSYRRIARARNVSEYTVSVQISTMLAKLDVGSTGELVLLLATY